MGTTGYTESTTTKLAVQNLFVKEQVKLEVGFNTNRTTRVRNTTNSTFLFAGYTNFLKGNPNSHELKLTCTKGGDNRTTTTNRFANILTFEQSNENSRAGRIELNGTVSNTLKGIYKIRITIISHTITQTENKLRCTIVIIDQERDAAVEIHPNITIDLSADATISLGGTYEQLSGLSLTFVYDAEMEELAALEGEPIRYYNGDVLISSDIIGYPEFAYTFDGGESQTYEPVGNTQRVYLWGDSSDPYFYASKPPTGQNYFRLLTR